MVLAIRKTLLNRQLACSRGLFPMLSSAWGLEPAHEHMTCLGRQKVAPHATALSQNLMAHCVWIYCGSIVDLLWIYQYQYYVVRTSPSRLIESLRGLAGRRERGDVRLLVRLVVTLFRHSLVALDCARADVALCGARLGWPRWQPSLRCCCRSPAAPQRRLARRLFISPACRRSSLISPRSGTAPRLGCSPEGC